MTPELLINTARPYSHYLNRHLDSGQLNIEKLSTLLTHPLTSDYFQQFTDWANIHSTQQEDTLKEQLRILRRYVMAHIMIRDLAAISNLDEVTRTITLFAEFAVNTALTFSHQYYTSLYGQPIGEDSGGKQFLNVVAMGKAGGYELNVSSDIDLIFIYSEDGYTNGKRERSNHEFFTKVGQKIIQILNDITADGQVFRVDMRLRPDGDSGPLVCSEAALEQYLITQGREWERYAWLKGRVITPYHNNIAALVRPFVYRKYLDFNAYEGMRNLHKQIKQEVARKKMADNIKLGSGGIREIEFIAQIFQLIRGGRIPQLQLKGSQETLKMLSQLNILPPETAQQLLHAYQFLRHVEHRLQYWDDQQTQLLPTSENQQQQLAHSMGFNTYNEFLAQLNQHRNTVSDLFQNILSTNEDKQDTPTHELDTVWPITDTDEAIIHLLEKYAFDGQLIMGRLTHLSHHARYRQLSEKNKQRFDLLIPQLILLSAKTPNGNDTLIRVLDFIESISRRSAYLALLYEYPEAVEKLVHLMSESSWVASYLQHHPILLDELLSDQLTQPTNDWHTASQELNNNLNSCQDDAEAKIDVLRHFQHAQTFRLAVQDLAGLWPVETLSDHLSDLTDLILNQALIHTWKSLNKKHCDTPRFAIIAYGKLGGKELGYTSDLDLVYLYDDAHPDAANTYARLAQRLTSWLTVSTGAGSLYEIDLRLRPNGEAGFVATHIDAFQDYQEQHAWTWEHQALTRARFICGDSELGNKFNTIRRQILAQARQSAPLKQEILSMRQKIAATHPFIDTHVKYAHGGIVDVEFIVQYLILNYAHQHPSLMENLGNIALLRIASEEGLINTQDAQQVGLAYRYYRQQQHNTKLRDTHTIVVDNTLTTHYQAVQQLWNNVFEQ